MNRTIYSLFIVVMFGVIQIAGIPIQIYIALKNPGASVQEILSLYMPYQFVIYIIGLIVILVLGNIHKDKNIFESGVKTPPLQTVAWIFGGLILAYGVQIITAQINIHLLGNPLESENTKHIMEMISNMPYMIFFVAVIGPIIEEYVFRRAIFAEIYERLPMNKIAAFLIAGLISGFVFAIAHFDFTHILIYVGMSYVFSFVYVMTNRLLVPIVVHMLMNGCVVLLQLTFKDQIEKLEQLQTNGLIIIKTIFNTII
ncbi:MULTISPECIES: CPBP family intramembrane glutamic endopeptidase [Nosocomiicoccus]|uniref:CPBP family intramembrane glutamic endopeptidase n=1 Tax=Nosocomiicoccus TaxID=489909 RepID=UPI00082C53E3|nr:MULTISPECIES: CPBP family intramembrane glutamic endopeptidase [Nosocomiicoccus]OFS61848.1 hypothetical protein HMPREF3177_07135 [Nosocomiicoccus sp. HMSC09A07]